MKSKIKYLIMALIMIFALASCDGETIVDPGTNIPSDKPKDDNPGDNIDNPADDQGNVEYSVTLMYTGVPFPGKIDGIKAIFINKYTGATYESDFESGAISKTKAPEGEYYVHLSKSPTNFSYDPNVTIVSPEAPNGEIELMQNVRLKSSTGGALYDPTVINNITVRDPEKKGVIYCYQATFTSAGQSIYYSFAANDYGIYEVESHADMFDGSVNPKAQAYAIGSPNSSYEEGGLIDEGGSALKGGYTKNFKFQIKLTQGHIGGVAKFRMDLDVKDSSVTFPITIPFTITYVDIYNEDKQLRERMFAEDLYAKRDSKGNIVYKTDSAGQPIYRTDKNGNILTATGENGREIRLREFELNYVELNESNQYIQPFENAGSYNKWIDPTNVFKLNGNNVTTVLAKRYSKTVNGEYVEDINGNYVLEPTVKPNNYSEKTNFCDFELFKVPGGFSFTMGSISEPYVYYDELDGYYHFKYASYDSVVTFAISETISLIAPSGSDDSGFSINISQLDSAATDTPILPHINYHNYKRFISGEYVGATMGTGYVFANYELVQFALQLNKRQGFFYDGIGALDSQGVSATEEGQWLYLCGFFKQGGWLNQDN